MKMNIAIKKIYIEHNGCLNFVMDYNVLVYALQKEGAVFCKASETGSNSYRLSVSYGTWGRVNTYDLTQTDLQQNPVTRPATTQNTYVYDYPGPGNLQDAQTVFAPAQRDIVGNNNAETEALTYGINGSLRRRDNPQQSVTEYYLHNSTANLKAYSNSGLYFAYYGYDAANTRTYKLSMLNQTQWVNGQPQPLQLQLQSAMFYPNAYLTFNSNGNYTKHCCNCNKRIISRMVENSMNICLNNINSVQFYNAIAEES